MASSVLTGMRFGRLTVLERDSGAKRSTGSRWICLCDCGVRISVGSYRLTHGTRRSCGGHRGGGKAVRKPPEIRPVPAEKACPYGDTICCEKRECDRCGWNPEVARARITKWRIAWEKMNS